MLLIGGFKGRKSFYYSYKKIKYLIIGNKNYT